jgi:hypothetical protein
MKIRKGYLISKGISEEPFCEVPLEAISALLEATEVGNIASSSFFFMLTSDILMYE